MKYLKFLIKIVAALLLSAFIYIVSAYGSKQLIFAYYKWHDKKYDWLAEYRDVAIQKKYKIVFIISGDTLASDRESGNRIIKACKNLGWEVYDFKTILGNEAQIRKINPDFIFTNKWDMDLGLKEKLADYKVYALLPHSTATYFGGLLNFYPQLKEDKRSRLEFIDGFIISMPQLSLFKNHVEKHGRKFYGFPGYSSVQHQDFIETKPKELVYMGMNLDSRRKSAKFGKIFKILAERNEAIFYGSPEALEPLVGDSYKGLFNGSTAALDILRQSGMTLLFHTKQHLNAEAPSGKGFEAAASSVIAISDRHPFLIENFGDSFLYVDLDASADRVVFQIEKHLDWIKKNPDKVKAKVRKAYDIFIAKYTLESLLLNLAHMHEKILIDEQKK